MKRYLIIVTLAVVAAAGCRRLNPFAEEQLVAQVGDERLYVSDVAPIFTTPLKPEDSIKMLERYVDAWVMRQLKIGQAGELFRESEPEIDKMVEDYRIALLTHRLDQYHVDARIDTSLTDNELAEYYNAHHGTFALDRTLVKGVVVRLPANHPRRAQVRGLMGSGGEKYQDFLELSHKNNFTVNEVSEWMDFAEFLRLLPTNNRRDYEDMLTRGGVQEMRDGDDLYLVLIRSHIRRGQPAPLELVREDIRRVIMNQRRQEIVRAYEDSLRSAAIAEKELKINIK
jgi:hypothetical protein